jgi:hypothetical protein
MVPVYFPTAGSGRNAFVGVIALAPFFCKRLLILDLHRSTALICVNTAVLQKYPFVGSGRQDSAHRSRKYTAGHDITLILINSGN